MIAAAGLGAVWLAGGLTFVLLLMVVRRAPIGPVATVIALLSLLALPLLSVNGATAVAAWIGIFAVALLVLERSALTRERGPRVMLAGVMAALSAMLFSWALASVPAAAVLQWPAQLQAAAMNGGFASLSVAAALIIFERRDRRLALAVRPWLLASWILLTVALLIDSVSASASPSLTVFGGWVAATVGLHLIRHREQSSWSISSARSWGSAMAHGGVALAICGFVASLALAESRSDVMRPGDRTAIGPWLVQLNNVTPGAGPGWTALEGEIEASRGAGPERLRPQQRYEFGRSSARSLPDAKALWLGRLSATLGSGSNREGWPIRFNWQPFIGVVWFGLGLAIAGGLLIAAGRGWRRYQRRPETDWRRRSYG